MPQTETITLQNEALTCFGLDKIEIRKNPLSLPKSAEGKPVVPEGTVLVNVRATGICGSDVCFKDLWPIESMQLI
jgi:threonine dehydrogenase-like Zn-dependent dehydrogenase